MIKSTQTGFIHHNYHSKDEKHDTIPIVENMCHVLELFRSKQAPNLYEGKFLLNKLLAFQSDSGNFPIYLHDYPSCYSAKTAFDLLAPMHHIQREFHSILGQIPLTEALEKLHRFCETGPENLLFDAARKRPISPKHWRADTASDWADLLVAATLLDQPIPLDDLAQKWHPTHQMFMGLFELQSGNRPQKTLLDAFLTADKSHPRAVLARSVTLPEVPISDLIFKREHSPAECHKAFHLLRWEHLVCQDARHHATTQKTEDGLECIFTYPTTLPDRDEKHMELNFYYPYTSGDRLSSNTFGLNEWIHIGPFQMRFELLEGKGQFFGHINQGNRPAQIDRNPTSAYDWRIGLRTVQRTSDAVIRWCCRTCITV